MIIDTWYIRSGTAISETMVVALNSEMNWLIDSGSMRRTTCGSTMRHRMSRSDMPQERAGFEMSERDGLDAGAEGLGEVAAVDEAQPMIAETNGLSSNRLCSSDADQQRQHEVHPHHHDVVGRVAKDLDVQRADPAQDAEAADAQQRGAQADRQRHDGGADEHVEVDREAAQQDGAVFPEDGDVEHLLQRVGHGVLRRCLEMNWRKRSDFGAANICAGAPSSSIRPLCRNITRSDTSRAKPISCVTTIMVVPSSASSRITRQHFVGELRVERGRGLVEQHHLGLHRERAGDGDALLLAAGQARRILVGLVLEVHAAQARCAERRRPSLRDRPRTRIGRLDHVAQHRHVRPQVELLEHDAEVAAHPVDLGQRPRFALAIGVAAKAQRFTAMRMSPEVGVFEMVDAAQERALARAAGADHADDVAAMDVEGDALEHLERAEVLVHVDHPNRRNVAHRSAAVGTIAVRMSTEWRVRSTPIITPI